MMYELWSDRDGETRLLGLFESPNSAEEWANQNEAEGFDYVLINRKTGKKWMLTDTWEELE